MRLGEFELVEPVPELRNTCAISMLRPWIDVGRVGTLTLRCIEKYLGAKELARLAKPGVYFDFTRYRPRMRVENGKRIFTTPNTIIHYAKDTQSERDYLFMHIREPHGMGEDYTDAIVGLLQHFNVTEYCRIGGMYDSVPHTRPLLVTGTVGQDQAEKAKGLIAPRQSAYQGPTSILNMVNESLSALKVRNTSLMAHLPQYVQLDEDHMGASRLIEVLCAVYDFPYSLADQQRGQQQYMDISKAVESNSEVRTLIKQLEIYYDRVLARNESEKKPSFSPDVENFLERMAERLEGARDEDDGED